MRYRYGATLLAVLAIAALSGAPSLAKEDLVKQVEISGTLGMAALASFKCRYETNMEVAAKWVAEKAGRATFDSRDLSNYVGSAVSLMTVRALLMDTSAKTREFCAEAGQRLGPNGSQVRGLLSGSGAPE